MNRILTTKSESASPDPRAITKIALGYRLSRLLISATELGVFTELAKNPGLSAEELARRVGIHPRGARDFFDALSSIGLLFRDKGNRYRNTPDADYFLDGQKPSYIGGYLNFLSLRGYPVWAKLTTALITGKRQSEGLDEDDLFSGMYKHPDRMRVFLHGMTNSTIRVAKVIAHRFPWEKYNTFIDIGCAEGALPVQLALEHEHLKGAGFDLPILRPFFEEYVRSFRLENRLNFVEGDFFKDEELPKTDVIVMGRILHDWNLEGKKMLIRKAYNALSEGGALIAYDLILDDGRAVNEEGLLLSLSMLLETNGGFEYTESQGRGWLTDAGFSKIYFEHLMGPTSMLVGIK
jgi:precorrin-6B methylase 2